VKTDDLIKALAADAPMKATPIERALLLALLAGLAVSVALFLIRFGVRPDVSQALGTVRYPFKFLVTLSLAIPAVICAYKLSRPDGQLGAWAIALFAAPTLLGLGLVLELIAVPVRDWTTQLVGHNSRVCLVAIPVLSLAPLVGLVAALRHGAVTQPRMAALTAGLASAGLGATLYASHCPDDSPLFLAAWYTLAAGIVVLISLAVAPRLLRW
jgi:hypothetical protein